MGVALDGSSNPASGVHAYVYGAAPPTIPTLNGAPIPAHCTAGATAVKLKAGVTFTCIASVAAQPCASRTVTVYVVVALGEAVGFDNVASSKSVAGDHEYVYVPAPVPPVPVGAPPITVETPAQIFVSAPASATSTTPTEMSIASLAVQFAESVTITLTVVFDAGVNITLEAVPRPAGVHT